jgi:hypothetical protein
MNRAFAPVKSVVEKPTPLNFKRVTVEVGDGQAKDGGLFAAGFISYRIRIKPLGYEVRRKDPDFPFLRKVLARQFPHVAVPPCSPATAQRSIPKSIERRERYFTRFLQAVMRSEELKSS